MQPLITTRHSTLKIMSRSIWIRQAHHERTEEIMFPISRSFLDDMNFRISPN